jgi:subtilisin family serine protease
MRRVILLVVATVVLTTVGVTTPVRAGAGDLPNVGPEVLDRLRAGETVEVVTMLDSPLGPTDDVYALQAAADTEQQTALDGLAARGGDAAVVHEFDTIPALTVQLDSEDDLRNLAAQPNVRRIDIDRIAGGGHLATTVPLIGADDLHSAGLTGAGTTVAVLDSGYDSDHPDLVGSVVHEACFGSRGPQEPTTGFCANGLDRQVGPGAAEDNAGHGTHVTGIITSDGVVSPVGVAPASSIVAIRVTDGSCGFAGCFFAFSEIVAALDHLAANPQLNLDAINMSFGTFERYGGDCDSENSPFMAAASAIGNLRAMGAVPFASAGNQSEQLAMTSPACLSGVVSLGATDPSDVVASFSNTSATTDLLAPGVSVVSDLIGGGVTGASGTSMASPTAAACTALMRDAVRTVTSGAIETTLETTGKSVTRGSATFPRVQCDAAVAALGPPPSETQIDIGNATLVEGEGSRPRALKFAVTLSRPSTTPVTVTVDVGGGTATEGLEPLGGVDYKGFKTPKVVRFIPGRTGLTPVRKFVTVPIYGDAVIEADETFNVTMSNATGGYVIGDGTGLGTIVDDDSGAGIRVSVGDATINEGQDGQRSVSLVVTLSEALTEEVRVDYRIGSSTANCAKRPGPLVDCLNADFALKTLIFKPNASTGLTPTSRTVNIPILTDDFVEVDEVARVELSNPRASNPASSLVLSIDRTVGLATIVNDD